MALRNVGCRTAALMTRQSIARIECTASVGGGRNVREDVGTAVAVENEDDDVDRVIETASRAK
jgi:hypothetical protein